MKTILILFCSAALAVSVRGGVIAFDAIGPDGVVTSDGTVISSPGPIHAANFTPSVAGMLSEVDFAIEGSPNAMVDVWLYGDNNGSPDWFSSVFLGFGYKQTDRGIIALPIVHSIPINWGWSYWLVLIDPGEGESIIWNQVSPAVLGATAVSHDNVIWNTELSGLPAFRIWVDTSLPDSGSTILLLVCAVAFILLARRLGSGPVTV